jgi:acyl-[acyl carrier protein]--UDP-N-acetylglucosamine O-acyltransferase
MLLSNVRIGPGSLVQSAILDEGVNIGSFCRIGSNGENLTVLEQHSVIPDYTHMGFGGNELVEVRANLFMDLREKVSLQAVE